MQDKRQYPKEKNEGRPTYEYSRVKMIICSGDADTGLTLLKSVNNRRSRDTYLDFTQQTQELGAGTYWISVKMTWDKESYDNFEDQMTLSFNCYGIEHIEITKAIGSAALDELMQEA